MLGIISTMPDGEEYHYRIAGDVWWIGKDGGYDYVGDEEDNLPPVGSIYPDEEELQPSVREAIEQIDNTEYDVTI